MNVYVQGQENLDIGTARAMVNAGRAVIAPGGGFHYVRPEAARNLSLNNSSYTQYGADRVTRKGAQLSFDMLRTVYMRSSAVRPPVDFLINTLSTTPFQISAMPGARVPKRDIKRAEALFVQPLNDMGTDTFRDLLSMLLKDILVLDHGIVLKHTEKGIIDAFEAMDAAKFHPVADKKSGRLSGWTYNRSDFSAPASSDYSREDIAFFRRGARTDSLYGTPIIETIVHEVQALLNASRSFSIALDKNEIPPGFLHIGGATSPRQLDRMKQGIKEDAGIHQSYKLRVITGAETVSWINIDRSNREMEVAQLVEDVEKIVFRNFGVDRIAMGSATDVNRSTAEEMVAVRNQSLIKPILDMLADKFTYDVLAQINPGLFIEFFYYARTGDEADLVDEKTSETSSARPNAASDKKSACISCASTGRVLYTELGESQCAVCPVCQGRGYRGPTYTARPRMLRSAVSEVSTPYRAWKSMATEEDVASLAELEARTKRNVTAVLSSMGDKDSIMVASNHVEKILTDMVESAHRVGASKVREAKFAPGKAGLVAARARISDLVNYNMKLAVELSGSIGEKNAVEGIATRSLEEAASIIRLASHVAGSALSSSVAVNSA